MTQCADLSPVKVEDLGVDRAECSLIGTTLMFPDGTQLPVLAAGSGGQVGSNPPLEYSFVTVGDFGIVAGQTTSNCDDTRTWGSAEAKKRVRDSFGDRWPCASDS